MSRVYSCLKYLEPDKVSFDHQDTKLIESFFLEKRQAQLLDDSWDVPVT
jgi:hypothetical protein